MANPKPATCNENVQNPNNSGVVLDVPMFEGSGNPGDVSGNSNNGVLGAGASWSTGAYGSAISLNNSSSGCVTCNSAVDVGSTFTLAISGNKNSSGLQSLMGQGNSGVTDVGFFFRVGGNSGFTTATNSFQQISVPDCSTGAWHRHVLTYDGSFMRYYRDGVLIAGPNAASGTPEVVANVCTLGRLGDFTASQFWDGLIDGPVILKNTVWTAAQIAQDAADAFARFRAISPIQDSPGANSTSGTVTDSFSTLPAAGNAVIVEVFGNVLASGTIPTVSDNQSGNSYSLVISEYDSSNKEFAAQWLLPAVVGRSGTFAVTATTGVNGDNLSVVLHEFNPGLTSDQTNSATGSTTAPAAGAVTTATADELAVTTFASLDSSHPATITAPTGYYRSFQQTNGAAQAIGAGGYEAVSATVSGENPTWGTDVSAAWSAAVATYKISSGSSPIEDDYTIIYSPGVYW